MMMVGWMQSSKSNPRRALANARAAPRDFSDDRGHVCVIARRRVVARRHPVARWVVRELESTYSDTHHRVAPPRARVRIARERNERVARASSRIPASFGARAGAMRDGMRAMNVMNVSTHDVERHHHHRRRAVVARATFLFATGNAGKLARAREHVGDAARIDAFDDAEAFELQLPTVRAVAIDKARRAAALVRQRARDGALTLADDYAGVIVHDCGLVVRALDGFPGPYTKDFNCKVGGVGLIKLLASDDGDGDVGVDRAASWDETLVLVSSDGEEVVFSREGAYDGIVSHAMPKKWTRWRDVAERSVGAVFVPSAFGFDECLADVSEDEYQRYRRDASSVWNDFAAHARGR